MPLKPLAEDVCTSFTDAGAASRQMHGLGELLANSKLVDDLFGHKDVKHAKKAILQQCLNLTK